MSKKWISIKKVWGTWHFGPNLKNIFDFVKQLKKWSASFGCLICCFLKVQNTVVEYIVIWFTFNRIDCFLMTETGCCCKVSLIKWSEILFWHGFGNVKNHCTCTQKVLEATVKFKEGCCRFSFLLLCGHGLRLLLLLLSCHCVCPSFFHPLYLLLFGILHCACIN